MRTRRTFTREFKRETACLVLDQGFSVKEVCEQFDLQDGALRRWVKQVQFERKGGVPETAEYHREWPRIRLSWCPRLLDHYSTPIVDVRLEPASKGCVTRAK